MNYMPCIVCLTEDAKRSPGAGDFARFDCPRCGSFALSGTAERTLETRLSEKPFRRSLMSYTLRRMQQANDKHLRIIPDYDLPTFWRNETLPSPQQQADNLILWIGDNQETSFATTRIDRSAIAAWIGISISLPANSTGWVWLNSQLEPKHLYEATISQGRVLDLRLTMEGWARYQSLKKTETESRTAFMAMKFNQPALDRVVELCFRPAVKRAGFKLRVLTDKQPAG